MASIHSASTKPELCLRKALWQRGFRYRLNDRRLPGSPDLVLPRYRTVIFVHGCFWHGHDGCSKYTIPKTNTDFWVAKVKRNKERDQEVWRQLEAKGWCVIIVWECELRKNLFEATIAHVINDLRTNGQLYENAIIARREYQQEWNRLRNEQKLRLRKMQEELLKH